MICVRDLHFAYASLPGQQGGFSIRCPELTVHPGEVCFLIGRNGTGKSTLAKMISGLHAPDVGSVLVNGRHAVRSQIRSLLVGVTDNLVGSLRVLDHLALGLALAGKKTGMFPRISVESHLKRRLEALPGLPNELRTEVTALMDHTCSELSSGQRQLVTAILAVLARAEAIVADETAANLDFDNARRLFAMLKAVAADDQVPVVAVSHDLILAAEYADRVYVLNNGACAELPLPSTVLERTSVLRSALSSA